MQIERKAAILNFASIAEAADGVILSRGNLGLDFDPGERKNLVMLLCYQAGVW